MAKGKYLAYNAIDGDYVEFDTLEEAQKYLKESFMEEDSYHPDMDDCKIFELKQCVGHDIIASQKDYTIEEWEDEGYSLNHEEIWKHKFINIEKNGKK